MVLTERHPANHSGLVIACVNCGIPLGAALLQASAGHLEDFGMMTPILAGCVVAMCAALVLLADASATFRKLSKASR